MSMTMVNEAISKNFVLDKARKYIKDQYTLETAVRAAGLVNLVGQERADQIEEDMRQGTKTHFVPTDFISLDADRKKLLTEKMREVTDADAAARKIMETKEFKAIGQITVKSEGPDGKEKAYVLETDHIAWLSNFVYFRYYEEQNIEDLTGLYKKLIDNSDLLSTLEVMEGVKPVKRPFDINFINIRIPNNSEVLIDALNKLPKQRYYKKFFNDLPRHLKADLKACPQITKDKFADVAQAFEELYIDPDTGKKWADKEKLDKADKDFKGFWGKMGTDTREGSKTFGQQVFMSPIYRYKTIQELLDNANGYLKALGNSNFTSFYEKFNQCNLQFGNSGAVEMFNAGGIFIIEVKSYGANRVLNGHTTHCIKDSLNQWNNYVNMNRERDFVEENKQYYIYNFNLPSSDAMWTIGATIEPEAEYHGRPTGHLRAAHNKTDHGVSSILMKLLKEWAQEYGIVEEATEKAKRLGATDAEISEYGPLYCIMRPLAGEEFVRKKAIRANNIELMKPGVSIDRIKYLVIGVKDENGNLDPNSGGADVNRIGDKKNCAALYNAVIEDVVGVKDKSGKLDPADEKKHKEALAKAELLLDLGALPNLFDNERNAVINFAKSSDMVRLLVSRGSILTSHVFMNICDDVDLVEFCLKSGLDPNFENSMPLRMSCKGSYKSATEPGGVYWDSFHLALKYGASMVDQGGNFWLLKWAAEYGRLDLMDFIENDMGARQGYVGAYTWMAMTRKRTPEDRDKTLQKLLALIDKYEPETWDALPVERKWHLRKR